MNQKECTITLVSEDRHIQAERGHTILEALIDAGILIRSDCSGKGRCGKCRVRICKDSHANISPIAEVETDILTEADVRLGFRLACQASVMGDISVEVTATTLLAPEVSEKGPTLLPSDLPVPAIQREAIERFGIAVDLGTTTIAVYLCDLTHHEVKASISIRNPQIIYGDDVMSRITVVSQNKDRLKKLQKMALNAVEWGIHSLCRSLKVKPDRLHRMAVVGNSTMIHLFVGDDPAPIGVYPYEPQFRKERTFKAAELGFKFNPATEVYTLPLISGFLGSDIVGAVIAANPQTWEQGTILVDVGTNGEVVLLEKNGFSATSCATGPAFEGASIRHGMHAVSGAIDAVTIDPKTGKAHCSVIQKNPKRPQKPSGICGSGVVSTMAALYQNNMVLQDGRLNRDIHPEAFQFESNASPEYILIPKEQTQANRAITFTQRDVRAIQLAKGALFAGIKLLCREKGISKPTQILLAGAFGSHINKEDAMTIGMFPDISRDKLKVVGNAAGTGAILTLFDEAYRQKAMEFIQTTKVVNLAGHPDFQEVFMASLAFP